MGQAISDMQKEQRKREKDLKKRGDQGRRTEEREQKRSIPQESKTIMS